MKVTADQIQFIDNYLLNAGVDFIDIRYEMTDHVAAAVEQMDGDFLENFKAYMLLHKAELLQNNKAYIRLATQKATNASFKTLLKPWAFIAVGVLLYLSFYFAETVGVEVMADNLFIAFLATYTVAMLPWAISFFTAKRKYAVTSKLLNVIGVVLYLAIINIKPGKNIENPWILFSFYSLMIVLSACMSITMHKLKKQYNLRYTN